MKFRRIYWATEQLDAEGKSCIGGIYTSIPDLIERGLHWNENSCKSGFRLNLVQLDSLTGPRGTWTSPDFKGLDEDLKEYVATGEFNETDCESLVVALRDFASKS